jgi:hypothetical protein
MHGYILETREDSGLALVVDRIYCLLGRDSVRDGAEETLLALVVDC